MRQKIDVTMSHPAGGPGGGPDEPPEPATANGSRWPLRPFRYRRRHLAGSVSPYLFVLPAVLFLVALLAYPLVLNVVTSFQSLQIGDLLSGGAPWVGLANYRMAFHDPQFVAAAEHSLIFCGASVVLQMAIGLGLALFYSQRFRWAVGMRSLYLVGYAIPVVVSAQVFRWMLDGRTGVVNWALQSLHLQDPNNPTYWLADRHTALLAIIMVQVWLGLPFTTITLIAGLTAVPAELIEAAALDGANAWQRFRSVTWPALRPTFLTAAILTVIFCFKSFDLVWITTQGGPAGSTDVLPTLAYRDVFQNFQFGEGAAILNLVFLVLLVVSVLYLRTVRREETA